MVYFEEERDISLIVRLNEWIKSNEFQTGEMGRLVAIALIIVVISYVIVFVARIVVAFTLPFFVIMGLLVIYRYISLIDVGNGLLELFDIMDLIKQFITSFVYGTNAARNSYTFWSSWINGLYGCFQ